MVDLSLEIPTYNEAGNLPVLIERLEGLKLDLEIIIIDDNSPDGTYEVAQELAEKYHNIKTLKRPGKLGLASAISDGLKLATGNYVAVMDADLQHPPETLLKMFEEAEKGTDIIIASRYTNKGGIGKFGLLRRLTSKGATFLTHALLRETRSIKDPMSGFFIFRRSILDGKKIESSGYKVLLEVLVKSGSGAKVSEIPYVFGKRTLGESKLTVGENLKFISLLLMLSHYRPMKFITVGATGILVNEGLLFFLHTYTAMSLLFAGMISIETSILSNFLLNHFWTFRDRSLGGWGRGVLKYNLVALPGALINLLTLLKLSAFTHYLIANIIGIILAFAVNYLGSEMIVWGRGKRRQ